MDTIIFGDGRLGRAIAAGFAERGGAPPRVLGRPAMGRHDPRDLNEPDLAIDAARGDAVVGDVAAALAAGCRRFVIATTGWDGDRSAVDTALRDHRATAVVGANLSLGVALFGRLVDRAVELLGPIDAFDPYLLEWHRRSKLDRPSGTARELSRRILAAHPRKRRLHDPRDDGPLAPDELDVAVVRAGSSPGMHLVGFDAPGETIELRLTARDRSAYVAGALAAVDWLTATPRTPGIVEFTSIVDELIAPQAVALARAG
ncbi:MAG: dihydrodipicolinate reductase C-terminal domain-containing protein [Candidatus Limnocylindrales bacterium]